MKKFIILSLMMVIAAACNTTARIDLNAEKEAVTAAENQWTEFFRTRNADKLISLYAPDAVSISPDNPASNNPVEHVKAILSDTTVIFPEYSAGIDKIDISASGDLASVVGHDATVQKTSAGTEVVKMRYVDVWKKIDGSWKIVTVIAAK